MNTRSKAAGPPRQANRTTLNPARWQQADTDRLLTMARQLDIPLEPEATERLATYAALLLRWNRTFNLLGATTTEELLDLHLLDCLAINPVLERWLPSPSPHLHDIGSGAGLPGIPLAITHPKWALTLVEPVSKKAAFLRQSVATLGLGNVSVIEDRIEALPPPEAGRERHFISRAFTALERFNRLCSAAGTDHSLIFAMKAAKAPEEIAELPKTAKLMALESLPTARAGHERVIVILAGQASLPPTGVTPWP